MAALRHLGFVWGTFNPFTEDTLGLYHSAKFGYDRCSSFDNMNVSISGAYRLENAYSRSQIWCFGAI